MRSFVLFLCTNSCIFERHLLFLHFFLSFMYKILAATPLFLEDIKKRNCLLVFLFVFVQCMPYTFVKPLHHISDGHFYLSLRFSPFTNCLLELPCKISNIDDSVFLLLTLFLVIFERCLTKSFITHYHCFNYVFL